MADTSTQTRCNAEAGSVSTVEASKSPTSLCVAGPPAASEVGGSAEKAAEAESSRETVAMFAVRWRMLRVFLTLVIVVMLSTIGLNYFSTSRLSPTADVEYVDDPDLVDLGATARGLLNDVPDHFRNADFTRRKNSIAKTRLDPVIRAVERHCITYDIGGYMFDETGRYSPVSEKTGTCLIHSFSPYVEQEAARRFLDPARDNIYFANSPAILWNRGELVLVSRIWLDREKYEPKNDWPSNHFADNWLYMQRFDRYLRPVSNGSILGIPAPKQWWIGDGPIEPRLVECQGHLLVSFNSAMAFKQQYPLDYTIIWDIDQNLPIIPQIEGGTPMLNATEKDDMPRDKHWMALVDNDELYFVHNLDPLRVLHCSLNGYCKFVHQETDKSRFIFSDSRSHLRGGTPFVLYRWPYYVSVAHTTMYKKTNNHRYYTAHIVVLCVRPYRVVYISNDIKIHQKLYKNAPMVRNRYIDEGFIFPVGLVLDREYNLDIGVHINDYSSVLIRVKRFRNLMERVIGLDRLKAPARGPPVGYLNQHIHDLLVNLTHIDMVHQ